MPARFRHLSQLLSQDSDKPPFLLHYRSSRWFVSFVVSTAVFTDIFLFGVIVPVVPFALTTRSGVDAGLVQYWVSVLIAVYGAALLAFSPLCGYFADHSSSRRFPLLLGLFALAGATVMLNVGSSIGILILGRVLQGISAAVVWVVGLALLVDTVGQKDIGQAMGYVGLAMSLGVLVSPLLGGVVFEKGGYNAVYAMAYALIGLDIVLRLFMIEKKVAVRWLEPDEAAAPPDDAAAQQVETGRPIVAVSAEKDLEADRGVADGDSRGTAQRARSRSPHQPSRFPSHASGTEREEKRTRLPPVITLLKSRRLLSSLWGVLAQAALLTAFDSTLPLFVRQTFGWNSTGAGLIFLPIVLPSFIAPLVGWLSDTYGPRWLATSGFALATPFLVLLRLVTHDGLAQKALLCALLALIGGALTLAMSPLMAEITYLVEAKERRRPGAFGRGGAYAQAYGLFNMAFAGGCMVGPIWAGFVNERAGWGTMAWSLAVLSFVSAIPTAVWCGGFIGRSGVRLERWGNGGEAGAEEKGSVGC